MLYLNKKYCSFFFFFFLQRKIFFPVPQKAVTKFQLIFYPCLGELHLKFNYTPNNLGNRAVLSKDLITQNQRLCKTTSFKCHYLFKVKSSSISLSIHHIIKMGKSIHGCNSFQYYNGQEDLFDIYNFLLFPVYIFVIFGQHLCGSLLISPYPYYLVYFPLYCQLIASTGRIIFVL